ncbi:MAG: hypothetical protein WBH44_06275 [Proteocatella sp.]
MQVCCTKKLIAVSGVNVDVDQQEKEKFYVWSANIISLDFRKVLVVVNDCTQFGFVMYGIELEEFEKLEPIIKTGIRRALEEENIEYSLIDKYFENVGDIAFSGTKGPVHVSKLNKVVLKAESYAKFFDKDQIYQSRVSKMINGHSPDLEEKETRPYKSMIKGLEILK